jgi:hypothetical protein
MSDGEDRSGLILRFDLSFAKRILLPTARAYGELQIFAIAKNN